MKGTYRAFESRVVFVECSDNPNLRSKLNYYGTVDVSINNLKWSNISIVKLTGSSGIKSQTFVAWLVIVVIMALVGPMKIIVDNDLLLVLQNCEIIKQGNVVKHISLKNDPARHHA
jgi:hypothetical protein